VIRQLGHPAEATIPQRREPIQSSEDTIPAWVLNSKRIINIYSWSGKVFLQPSEAIEYAFSVFSPLHSSPEHGSVEGERNRSETHVCDTLTDVYSDGAIDPSWRR
jgi:hypothetical protein